MAFRPQLGESLTFPVRVFVLADDALAAEGVRAALRADARIACVTELREAEVAVWDFGPLALGGQLPSREPAALTLTQATPGRLALLVLVPDDAAGAAALALGANGVLERSVQPAPLAAAVIALRLGLCVFDAALADNLLELPRAAAAHGNTSQVQGDEIDALTVREQEVLESLALGLSNRAIAERMGVSVHTVKFHVNGILAKLQVDSRAGAVAKAMRRGLVRT